MMATRSIRSNDVGIWIIPLLGRGCHTPTSSSRSCFKVHWYSGPDAKGRWIFGVIVGSAHTHNRNGSDTITYGS